MDGRSKMTRRESNLTTSERDHVVALYSRGEKLVTISKLYRISPRRIQQVARMAGLPPRSLATRWEKWA